MNTSIAGCLSLLALIAVASPTTRVHADRPQSIAPDSSVILRVSGAVETPLALTAGEFATLPRREMVAGFHDHSATYSGVPITELLARAGVPLERQIRGGALRYYIVVHAADGYAAVFALAELDSGFTDRVVLVADRRDGEALPADEGPLRMVVPGAKRGARWVRMVTEIEVRKAP